MNIIESTLLSLEKTKEEFWNISRETGDFIEQTIIENNIQNMLELGTSNGYSGIRAGLALKKTGGKLTTIEYWEKRRTVAVENFKKCGLETIITAKLGHAYEVISNELLSESYDLVFIDANKAGYLKFFEIIHPLLKQGGIIIADDIISHAASVKPFVDVITTRQDYKCELLNLPDGVLKAIKII